MVTPFRDTNRMFACKKNQKTNQRSDRHLATKKEHQKVASKIMANTPKISLKCLILACGQKIRIFDLNLDIPHEKRGKVKKEWREPV